MKGVNDCCYRGSLTVYTQGYYIGEREWMVVGYVLRGRDREVKRIIITLYTSLKSLLLPYIILEPIYTKLQQ